MSPQGRWVPGPQQDKPPVATTPSAWREATAFEPAWTSCSTTALCIGTINANGLNRANSTDSLAEVFVGMAADIVGVCETHWRQTQLRGIRYNLQKHKIHMVTTTHENDQRQKGVAVLLSERLSRRKTAEEQATEEGQELGTAIRVQLAFHQRRVQVIIVYRPPGAGINQQTRRKTDRIVLHWLQEARRAGEEAVVMGDLNTQLWQEQQQRCQIERVLSGPSYADVWRTMHGGRTGPTYPQHDPTRTIDYILVSAGLRRDVRQTARMLTQSTIGEDHCQLWTAVGGLLGLRGPTAIPAQEQPRYACGAASDAQWEAYRRAVGEHMRNGKGAETAMMHAATATLPTKQRLREQSRKHMRLHQASALGQRLGYQAHAGWSQRNQWLGTMEQAKKLLREHLPNTLMQECGEHGRAELNVCLADPTQADTQRQIKEAKERWRTKAKLLTRRVTNRLQEAARREAERRNTHTIAQAVRRNHARFEKEPGAILRKLRRGRRYAVLDRIVQEPEEGTLQVETEPDTVKRLAREHFEKHFQGVQEQPATITGVWAEEYTRQYDIGLAGTMKEIGKVEWAECIAQSPRDKAPGPSGITFEMVQKAPPEVQERLRKMCNCALATGELLPGWTAATLIPIPKKPTTDRELAQY
ncbi:hypothetical protein GGF40_002261 [Coemansia sp. RSA 1286]|nr:hypothetical protein GGF40_002261 [Coemansia sp. RSA 1286]